MQNSEIAALIERVEKASEGDFDLDKSILSMMGYSWRGMNYWHRDNKTMWPNGASVRFTTSIDAAVALIERVLPGWGFYLRSDKEGHGCGLVYPDAFRVTPAHCMAPTPALAMILALLRALQSQEPR